MANDHDMYSCGCDKCEKKYKSRYAKIFNDKLSEAYSTNFEKFKYLKNYKTEELEKELLRRKEQELEEKEQRRQLYLKLKEEFEVENGK